MSMPTLTIPYAGSSTETNNWCHLEQQPVPDNRLSLYDLQQMFGLVVNGVSARGYLPTSCPAQVSSGLVSVGLMVWSWPSTLDLAYTLTANMGEFGERVAIMQEREFNLTIDFEAEVDLPFYCESLTWEWTNIPCLDRYGHEISPPTITATKKSIRTSGNFFTVIRVRALARGYAHPLTIEVGKSGEVAITDIDAKAMVVWANDGGTVSETVNLKLPLCAEMLLAACEETSAYESVYGSVFDDDDKRPVLYYNGCTGKVMVVRYE